MTGQDTVVTMCPPVTMTSRIDVRQIAGVIYITDIGVLLASSCHYAFAAVKMFSIQSSLLLCVEDIQNVILVMCACVDTRSTQDIHKQDHRTAAAYELGHVLSHDRP